LNPEEEPLEKPLEDPLLEDPNEGAKEEPEEEPDEEPLEELELEREPEGGQAQGLPLLCEELELPDLLPLEEPDELEERLDSELSDFSQGNLKRELEPELEPELLEPWKSELKDLDCELDDSDKYFFQKSLEEPEELEGP